MTQKEWRKGIDGLNEHNRGVILKMTEEIIKLQARGEEIVSVTIKTLSE